MACFENFILFDIVTTVWIVFLFVYLQVDYGGLVNIKGVQLQNGGANALGGAQVVEKFSVTYSYDGKAFFPIYPTNNLFDKTVVS